jgi:hypothetical protein
MKTFLTFSFILFLALSAFSQKTPEFFLGNLPAIPSGVCSMSSADKNSFSDKVSELSSQIKEEIEKRKAEITGHGEVDKTKMLQNMADQTGLSATEMAKLQSGGQLSEAEGLALANRMMGQQYNISVEEAKNVGKMGKEGQKAWGVEYSAEMMADAQANPDKYKADQVKIKNMYELVKEKKELTENHLAMSSKFTQQFKELENDTSENQTLRNISKWTSEWYGMSGVDYGQGSKMDALAKKIKSAKIDYCNNFTPRFFEIYRQYLTYVKKNLPDYYRMEELEFQIMEAQTKVNNPSEPGLLALQIVSDYVNSLKNVFKYSLYSSENDF